MRKRILSLIMFTFAIAALIASLQLMNWIPGFLQDGLLTTYHSMEEVKAKLHLRDVYLPSYYPQGLSWPPTRIMAQSRPFIMLLTEFRRQGDDKLSLVISQTSVPNPAPPLQIKMLHRNEQVHYPLKGKNALLEVGLCGSTNEPCSRIVWDEPFYHIEVIMLSLPTEIVKIAESMHVE